MYVIGNALAVIILAVLLLVLSAWHRVTWVSLIQSFRPFWFSLIIFIGIAILHEGLHGLGYFVFGRASLAAIHIGFYPKGMAFLLECEAPLTKWQFMSSLLLPTMAIGILPLPWGLVLHMSRMVDWSLVNIASGAGDFALAWHFKRLPASQRLQYNKDAKMFKAI